MMQSTQDRQTEDATNGLDSARYRRIFGLFLLGYLGLLISNFPYIVPPSLTIWQIISTARV
jgi:cytochrome d ubiquinol oxidase subunit II